MKSTKKRQKQSNQHTSSINIFIYIDIYRFPSRQKKKKKITLVRLGFEPRTLGLQGKFSPIDLTRKGQEAYSSISNCNLELKIGPCSRHLIKKSETTLPIAYSLSYNILNFGRKLWNNNRDTGKEHCHADSCLGKKWSPHWYNTQIWKIMHCRL